MARIARHVLQQMASGRGPKRSPTGSGTGAEDGYKELRTSHGCGTQVADRWAPRGTVQQAEAVAADETERMMAAAFSAAAADFHLEVQRS